MASTYSWIGGSGLWSAGGNWADLTNPGAGTAPVSADTASIASADGFDEFFGAASAATLDASGDVAFAGDGAFGSFGASGFGEAEIVAGSSISAATATLGDTVQIADPGAALAVSGALTLDGANINLFDHGSLRIGSLPTGSSGHDGAIALDATSTAEIGTADIATAGTLAIDPGVTLDFGGSIYAPLLDQGSIVVTGFVNLYGPVSGTGDLVLGPAGASLGLNGGVGSGNTASSSPAPTRRSTCPARPPMSSPRRSRVSRTTTSSTSTSPASPGRAIPRPAAASAPSR